jgi:hypothetical protein
MICIFLINPSCNNETCIYSIDKDHLSTSLYANDTVLTIFFSFSESKLRRREVECFDHG